MKPFNLEAAKSGHPVMLRDGRSVRLICFDRLGNYPIVGLLKRKTGFAEETISWTIDGSYNHEVGGCSFDLFMAPRKAWVNLYQDPPPALPNIYGIDYSSKENADAADRLRGNTRIACVEIEL